jgi:hypothetical protein
MAVWALARLGEIETLRRARERLLPSESDPAVLAEWAEAIPN